MPEATRHFRDGGGWEAAAGYSRAVRRFGRISVSGTTANAADGNALHPGDTYGQARAALERALAAVVALGGQAEDVVRSRVYLAPEADWKEASRAHAAKSSVSISNEADRTSTTAAVIFICGAPSTSQGSRF